MFWLGIFLNIRYSHYFWPIRCQELSFAKKIHYDYVNPPPPKLSPCIVRWMLSVILFFYKYHCSMRFVFLGGVTVQIHFITLHIWFMISISRKNIRTFSKNSGLFINAFTIFHLTVKYYTATYLIVKCNDEISIREA